MCLSYPLIFVWCCDDKVVNRLRLPAIGFLAYAFLFSGSRKVVLFVLLLVAYSGLYIAFSFRAASIGKKLAYISLFSFALLAMVLWTPLVDHASTLLVENQVIQRFDMLGQNKVGHSDYIRQHMLEVALELWSARPIIGQGAGQFGVLGGFHTYSHNTYAESLANLGVIGLALYCVLPLVILARSIRTTFLDARKGAYVAVTVLAMLMLAAGFVATYDKVNWILLVYLMVLAGVQRATAYHAEFSGTMQEIATEP